MPDQNAPEPDRFTVSALTPQATHILSLNLEDALPTLTDARYQFKASAESLFSQEQPETMRIDVKVEATARPAGAGKASPKAKVRLRVAVLFRYQGLEGLRKNGALPLELGWTAVSIAYSTVRGIFQARLAGTSFDKALLPIVSPQQLWQPNSTADTNTAEAPE
jgi:hypothetical protein